MSTSLWLVAAGLVGLAAGLGGAAAMLARVRRSGRPIDVPDPRRLHHIPTPRGGGGGFALAMLVVLPLALAAAVPAERDPLLIIVLVWALPNALLGFVDDHRALPPQVKLGIQLAASAAAVFLGLRLSRIELPPFGAFELGWLAGPFSVVWLVWLANAFNFMDGIDALAAECGALFFAGLAGLALLRDAPGHAALAIAAAGALLGFLRFNLPPAKIFMGDVGSLCSGALLGGIALALDSADVADVPLLASAVLVGGFVFDATFTVVRRALRGVVLRPHRSHFYQRLVLAGWSQTRVRMTYLGMSGLGLLTALALVQGPAAVQAVTILLNVAGFAALVAMTRSAERRARNASGPP